MKLILFFPAFLFIAACHFNKHPGEPADAGAISFADSIAEQLVLNNEQLAFHFQLDTTALQVHYTGKELRDLGNYYVMVLDVENSADWLYVVDKKTGFAVDDDVLEISSGADDNPLSQSAYEIVNDSTIKVLEEVFESEQDQTPEIFNRTYTISHTGHIVINDE
jgi:hypothetical protein